MNAFPWTIGIAVFLFLQGRPPKIWMPTERDGEDLDVLPRVEKFSPWLAGKELEEMSPAKAG